MANPFQQMPSRIANASLHCGENLQRWNMTSSRIAHIVTLGLTLAALGAPASAQTVGREQDIVGLRLGQRVLVDDGTCPIGQVKEVSGAKMTPSGVLATRRCIPRFGPKKK
jgi:hypothetical protein